MCSAVPRTELIGEPDRYVKVGSTVALHCVVRGALEPPSYIIWYHDAHQLLSENQQKWKIKLDRGMPDSDGDIPNVVSFSFVLPRRPKNHPSIAQSLLSFHVCHLIN